ncbi:MAG: rhodanese-like domain-containing protein, partial [Candidatus Binatia bacterium]
MRNFKAVVLEALVLAVAGLLVALAANALSPRGLRITRNYFPSVAIAPTNVGPSHAVSANPADAVIARLQRQGLKAMASNEVSQLFRDPAHEQGLILFIDARNDHAYQSGHIPGAWQLDYYRPENYLPSVMPMCLGAQKIVVYCTGGMCEDSELTAVMLRHAGIPADNL